MSNRGEEASVRRRMQSVIEAPSEDLRELIAIAGLDPAEHLRFQNWAGSSFRGNDLCGFDFTGARLLSCDFTGALLAGARFDKAEIARTGFDDGQQTNLRAAKDWAEFAAGWQKPAAPATDRHLRSSAVFQDAPFAPEMVVIPRGRFWMGSEKGDWHEPLRHEQTIPHALAVGRYPVTFQEWDFAQADTEWRTATGTRPRKPNDQDWGRGRRPVIDVSWDDAEAYIKWLSHKTGQPYRLLSEAEWEYACRAGSESTYCFGESEDELGDYAWYRSNSEGRTHPIGEKKPNAYGLYDMHGNVCEWCQDKWKEGYNDAPNELKATGDAWTTLDRDGRVLRGGSWGNDPQFLRAARPGRGNAEYRFSSIGFRVARTITS